MAIVAEFEFENGTSSINDECFAHKTKAEQEAEREYARSIARRIITNKLMREQKET
nr:hypothetical protein [uncultured Butyricicoccus sp.]